MKERSVVELLAGALMLAALPLTASSAFAAEAPSMTADEMKLGSKIYFERCAGCHGVLRKGATGKPLTPDVTVDKGTDYLKAFIGYGSPGGRQGVTSAG